MFRRDVKPLSEVLGRCLRENGLEGPMLEKRTIDAWDEVVGPTIARYTTQKYIRNQTMYVKIASPALRQDLSMMRTRLLKHIVEKVGSQVVVELVVM